MGETYESRKLMSVDLEIEAEIWNGWTWTSQTEWENN